MQGLSTWIAAQEGDPRDNEFERPASLYVLYGILCCFLPDLSI